MHAPGYYAKAAYSENDNIILLTYWTEKSDNTQIWYSVYTKASKHVPSDCAREVEAY